MYKYKYVYETVGDERPTVIDEINDLTYEKTKNKKLLDVETKRVITYYKLIYDKVY